MDSSSKKVVVTGAASGIGQATALRFAGSGHVVYGADMNEKGLDETQALIRASGGNFIPGLVDVRDEKQVKSFVGRAVEGHGSLAAAVSCAGVARTCLVHELDFDEWSFLISVNLTGTFLLAKYAMAQFVAERRGAFVAVSSDAGVRGASGYAAYCASKHGVVGLVKCLALDYGRYGIRANAVCPGFVETRMMEQLFAEASDPEAEKTSYAREVPIGRFAKPIEIANVIHHLASEEASYTNGICYSIDGGVTAGHFE